MVRFYFMALSGLALIFSFPLPAQDAIPPGDVLLEEIDPFAGPPVSEPPLAEEEAASTPEGSAVEALPAALPLVSMLTLDAVVVVDYTFKNSPDKFKIKYALNLGGRIRPSSSSLTGDASVATDVTGYLAKWPTGECRLSVTIGRIPYEIQINPVNENEKELVIDFKQLIEEDWKSQCQFVDDPGASFNTTTGFPEMWMGKALVKTTPSLESVITPFSPQETTTTRFTIDKQSIVDEGLGTAQIEGTGVITIEPVRPKTEPLPIL